MTSLRGVRSIFFENRYTWSMADLKQLRAALADAEHVAVLTGAGLSAASGLATFRGAGGLWRSYRAQDLATPDAYARDPDLVWAWYFERFTQVMAVKPNRAHVLLAALATSTRRVTLVTQNVDGLQQRAGSRDVLEMHGNLTESRCERCGNLAPLSLGTTLPPTCPVCGNRMRPNVVWFGERLSEVVLERAAAAFSGADVALIIGTSGVVEPAASLGFLALGSGALVAEINPEPTPLSAEASLFLQKDAAEGLALLTQTADLSSS